MSLVLLLGLSPTLLQAAALTEQQIQAIMNLVRSFSADEAVVRSVQLSLEGKTPVIAPQVHIQTPPKIGCIMLTTNLRYRMEEWTTGGQISLLQDFLKTRGLFKQKSNGFFGVTTLQAVNKFQESVGLSSTGFVGPLTRGKIKEQTCGGVVVIPMRPPIGKIAVLSPNGGETWQKGTTQTIKWNSNLVSIPEQPIIYDISLVPYCPSGQVCATYAPFAIAQGVSGSTYTWNVGSTVGGSAPAGSYTVQICQSGTTTCDSSDSFFTIAASYTQPSITVLSPNGGESLVHGQTYEFRWTSNGLGRVSIQVSDGKGYSYSVAAGIPALPGSYSWTVSNRIPPASTYRAGIGWSAAYYDQSDSDFTIAASYTQPSITVLSPNGGEYFRTGAAMTINWKTANVPASHTFDVIRLRAYPNGQEYNLVHNIANDGQEIITIPSSIPIGTYTLEIKSYFNGVLVMDASDSYFKIVSADSTNLPPVVDGVSGPTSLKVGETGTWTIKARDPENGALSYSVDWGDGVPRVFITNDTAASPFVQQPSTFTHSYATAGRYNVKFTVTDDKGLTAQSSITVQVSTTAVISNLDLSSHITEQIDSRLNAADPTTGLSQYLSRSASESPRNPNVWTGKLAPLDFTGVSGWKEYAGNYVPYGATLITPRHFVAANHVLLANGTRVTFFDRNGKPVTRTVLNSRRISNTDISIGVLDGNVDSIAHYPVVDTATLKRLIDSDGDGRLDGVPIIIFNQLGETLVRKMTVLDSSSSPILPGAVVHSRYLDGFRAGFSKELIVGDSGHPIFTVINNTPVILAENFGSNLGHAPGSHIDEINSAIIALGDYGFRVTEYSLSSFEPAPSITVLTPPGSRPWQLGATQNITWQSTGISKVVISLCTGASTARRCERLLGITATGIANTNSYAWYISPDQPNIYDGNWNIRVASADTPSVFDDSNSFALLDPLIVSISSPAGNIFTAPASFTVRAEAQNTLGSVTKVEFYQNGAKVSEDTTAPYEYHAQNLVVGGYSFEAKAFNSRGDTARSGGTDVRVNDTPQPSITVLSPNGGEYFRTGAAMTINWKTANVPASHTFDVIRLRAYPNGQEYNLVHNIANDGQEIITIPSSIPIGTYTLEIKSYFNGVLVMDASDSYFKIVSADSTNLPPVVDGVSGPTSLKVGETGTWTIKARDPENGALSYSVDWGDGVPRVFITNDTAASPFVQQPSTFTHSYATAGRYNVKFTVTDDKGLTAQSSITVQVGSTVPPITVLSPNGGETWQKGTTQTIKWNSNLVSIPEQPIIYDISLVPYCPSGQVCATYAPFAIAQGVSGSTYNWTVGKTASGGDIPAGQYKVTISSAANGSVTDQSDSAFTIAGITTQSTDTSLSPEAVSALAEFSQKKNLNLASILAAIAQLIEAFK